MRIMSENTTILLGLLLLISSYVLAFVIEVMILALPIVILRILIYTDPREKLVMLLKSWWLIQDLILMKSSNSDNSLHTLLKLPYFKAPVSLTY
jgi:hypothetical protein